VDGKKPVASSIQDALRKTGAYPEEAAKEATRDELDRIRTAGEVSPAVYEQFADKHVPHESAGSSGTLRTARGELRRDSTGQAGARGEGLSAVVEKTPRIPGSESRDTSIALDDEKLPAKYRIVDLKDLTPSHDGLTFAKNAGYPENVQQRNYHTDKHAQNRVVKQGQAYDPDYVLNTNNDSMNAASFRSRWEWAR